MDAVLCALAGDARGDANGMAVPDSRCVLVQPITDEWSYGTVLPDTARIDCYARFRLRCPSPTRDL
jgi:hypothetical protein